MKSAGTIDPKTFEGVSSLIATELGERRRDVQIVGAAEIRAMIGFEKEKQLLGCSEGACLAEIGGALGVEYLLATEGLRLGGTWVINMSLIDVARSKAVPRTSQRTKTDDKLVDICLDGVREVAKAIPVAAVPVVETKPAEVKPSETKPVEAKPVETKPAEDKPVEAKPVEAKPVEAVPVEAKPAETVSVAAKTTHPYSTPGWTVFGAGVAVAAAGGACLGVSWSQYGSFSQPGAKYSAADLDNGNLMATLGVVGISVGAAALVTGVILVALPGHSDAPKISLVPTPHGAFGSVTFTLP